MEFELIWLDGWLNWPRGIFFRQDSEPKWLQIQRNILENTQNHTPKKFPKDQKRPDFWKPISPKNVKSQWDFLTNRELELIYKARQMRNCEVIWYKIVLFLCIFSMCQVVQDQFLKSGFSSLLWRVDINSKIWSRNGLLKKTYPKMSFFMRNDWKWMGPTGPKWIPKWLKKSYRISCAFLLGISIGNYIIIIFRQFSVKMAIF